MMALVKRPKYWLARALGGEVELERTKQRLNHGLDLISGRTGKTNEVVKVATEEKLEELKSGGRGEEDVVEEKNDEDG
ncbi:hypothetical protein C1H46_039599 [Malus baccata]|uniref:Uncharacterized protein n=1 Tax=Malus baccata TaxID=106549 RepID=A0A540KKY6_MALBA|nr:hypothetical protein C1H46_039599 [Malus baccata]